MLRKQTVGGLIGRSAYQPSVTISKKKQEKMDFHKFSLMRWKLEIIVLRAHVVRYEDDITYIKKENFVTD